MIGFGFDPEEDKTHVVHYQLLVHDVV